MIWWILLLVILLIICVYIVARKIYNEKKIKNSKRELAGKVVLITGSSSGIGEALAHKFYASGCKLILAARRVGELERVRRDLLNIKLDSGIQSIRPDILQLDLAYTNRLAEKAHQILNSHTKVDILINNAGVSMISGIRTVKHEVDANVMNINYFGTIALTKATNQAIEAGQKPQDCANEIFRAVLCGDNEITVWKFLPVVWLRSLCPSIYFRLMENRARTFAARESVAHIV